MITCISANNLGFLLNVAGIAMIALSIGDPGGAAENGGLRGTLSYIKRRRLCLAGLAVIGCSVVFLVIGAGDAGTCLAPGAFLAEKTRALCRTARPIISPSSYSSSYAAAWSVNLSLMAIVVLVAFLAQAAMRMTRRLGTRILIGVLCAVPLLSMPLFFISKLLWVSSYRAAVAGTATARTFSFENYGGDKESLNAALRQLFPDGTQKNYVDSILMENAAAAQAVSGPGATYLHRTTSFAGCLFSEQMPPPAWQVNASYSPDLKLKALFAVPVPDTAP